MNEKGYWEPITGLVSLLGLLILGGVYLWLIGSSILDIWSDWNNPSTRISLIGTVVVVFFWHKLDKISDALRSLRGDLTSEISSLRDSLKQLGSNLDSLESNLKDEISALRDDLPDQRKV